jgi:dihydropteroate synthase
MTSIRTLQHSAIAQHHKLSILRILYCATFTLRSNRPGAADVSEAEELQRVIPVIQALRSAGCTVPISIDTRSAAVARAAISAGATLVNDVSAGTHDSAMLPALAAAPELQGVPYIAMHMRGTPQTMTTCTQYADVVSDVISELASQFAAAEAQGVPRWLLVCDPGVGFAKTAAQSLALMAQLQAVSAALRCPLLIGPSRKRFIGSASGADSTAAQRTA